MPRVNKKQLPRHQSEHVPLQSFLDFRRLSETSCTRAYLWCSNAVRLLDNVILRMHDADSQPPARIRLHRSRHLRRTAAGRRACRDAEGRADLVERTAEGRRRFRRRRLLGGDQAQGRQGGVGAQRRVLQPGEDGVAALPGRPRGRSHRAGQVRPAQHGRATPHASAQDHLAGVHAAGGRTTAGRTQRARAEPSPRPPRRRGAATSSSRCPPSCRCRRSPA